MNDVIGAVSLSNITAATDYQVRNLALTFSIAIVQPTSEMTSEQSVVKFLHRPAYCDCALLAKDAPGPLYASRTVLSNASPFFRTMFKGKWADSRQGTETPIQFTTWHAPAVALALIHIYSGWLPGMVLPKGTKQLVREFACDPDTLEYPTWRNLFELSQMLELKPLTLAVNRQLVEMLEAQYRDLANAEAAQAHRFSDESDDDEAAPPGSVEGAVKDLDHVEQEAPAFSAV
ncbi:hypothetical protein GGF32_004022 [Allomyces javanicus]|nr:hypothetical protein GGF32_004022 [Allomyces javanicus]